MRQPCPALLAILGPLLLLAFPPEAGAEYVRDEIRVNMRTGPGVQYRITKVLVSGDAVTRIASTEDWVQVRTENGEAGWIPAGYVTDERPASVRLPTVEAKLRQAEAHIEEVEGRLASQARDVEELASLRQQVEQLTVQNIRLAGSSRWKMIAAGGATVLVGMLIGALVPRGGSQRTRRIKL